VVEQIDRYDEGKYSIAYNMYTFAEKQFESSNVTLLQVDGVAPTDASIFDESYPIVIYNYLYYDQNNSAARELALNLYTYLMSDEGQKLISESGYVNLHTDYERNTQGERLWDPDEYGHIFHDPIKGEFYAIKYDDEYAWQDGGELLTFKNYPDYVLRDTPKHKDNAKAREFITSVYASDNITLTERTLGAWEDNISFGHFFGGGVWEAEFCFNFRYYGKYFMHFEYDMVKDKYFLKSAENESYSDEDWYVEAMKPFEEYLTDYEYDLVIEITKADLKNLYIRSNHTVPLEYVKLFG